MTDNTKYYTAKQAAERLNIRYATLWRWVRDGAITPTIDLRESKVVLFTDADLAACSRRKDPRFV